MTIEFWVPTITGKENDNLQEMFKNAHFSGDHLFTDKCKKWFKKNLGAEYSLMTPSCTHALELAALLIDIQPGDEVIMPSFTFVSTANAFVLRGAKIKFIDICPDTLNLDASLIESAITQKTKAIVPVHYAGIPAEMDSINELAKARGLKVIEDSAQALLSEYKGIPAGLIGDFGCFSFHETKNIQCGEGGVLFLKDHNFLSRAEIFREKGTNRSQFFRGQIDKYSWQDMGSSYLLSDLNAAFLFAQLEDAKTITEYRLNLWNHYQNSLQGLVKQGKIECPHIPKDIRHNGHLYYLKTKDLKERTQLMNYLKERGIQTVFHFVPLHSAPAGKKYSEFVGEDVHTTKDSERLLRLPLHQKLDLEGVSQVAQAIEDFYRS